ncbi:hypothetical protein RHMOL_Rhmol11G0040300 [Rhododendron molle]|uniref:Uncharacterized protein n=1 Tax=Rhododendron molle TaxID=49168 RepID=A0ACC0LNP1_RHOML|nr:hypothetical protein RHMOL_Rhmol11G0040300 [Rhododendron molle]
MANPEPVTEVAVVADLSFWERLGRDLGLDMESEPFINPETGELLPGFEVFADDTWFESDDEPARKEFKRKISQDMPGINPEIVEHCIPYLRRNLAFKYKVDRNPKRRARSLHA